MAEEAHRASEVDKTVAKEAEDERPTPVEGKEVRVLSTSSYNSLSSSRDNMASFSQYHKLGLLKFGNYLKALTPTSNVLWRTKNHIGLGIEIYDGVDITNNPLLDYTIVFYVDFLKDGIRTSLTPLAISFLTIRNNLPTIYKYIVYCAHCI